MSDREQKCIGVLLAGGQSRRMGGGDKGLLPLDEKPMMAHALDRLRPQVSKVILNANGDPGRFAQFNLPVVPDLTGGSEGPLAGVLAGLRWAADHAPHASHIVTVSSDAPFLPDDLVSRLQDGAREEDQSIALAASDGHRHPVIGYWPVALADDLEESLQAGVRKVVVWTGKHGFATVSFPFVEISGQMVDPFFNANTPEELDVARTILQTAHDS